MAALFRQGRNVCQCQRTFSTFTPRRVTLQWEKNDPEVLADALPPYPHGPAQWYKQSRQGLYGGSRIQFGNNVSEEFETKTRRTWHPNIHTKKLFSKALNRHVQVRVRARVLRTIDKLGGLDEYLLGEKDARIKELGETGWWLRWAIMQTPAVRARFAGERRQLGLPEGKEEVNAAEEAVAYADGTEEAGGSGDPSSVPVAADSERAAKNNRIRFRVAPKTHLYRSRVGWKRAWAQSWLSDEARDKLVRRFYPHWKSSRMDAAKAALQEHTSSLAEADRPSAHEQRRIIEKVEADLTQELRRIVDTRNEILIERRRRRASLRSPSRRRARAAFTQRSV